MPGTAQAKTPEYAAAPQADALESPRGGRNQGRAWHRREATLPCEEQG